jgi:FixJ family two-component response regulator
MLGDLEKRDKLGRRPSLAAADICVIAEHRAHRHSLVMLLRAFGLAARPFVTTTAFLRHWSEGRGGVPKCAIIDLYRLNEPLSVCLERVRSISGALPILLLSGVRRSAHRQLVEDRGQAVIVLIKPYEPPVLSEAVKHLLGSDAVV